LIFTSRIKKDGNLNKINNGFYSATMLISIISLICTFRS